MEPDAPSAEPTEDGAGARTATRHVRPSGGPGSATVVVVALTGIALSTVIGWELFQRETRILREEFEVSARVRVDGLERELAMHLEALSSLKAAYDTLGRVDRRRFRSFAAPMLARHPEIQALEWVPRVAAGERDKWEAAARQDGHHDFQFTELASPGRTIRAAERAEYFPIYFVEPLEGNRSALGFDVASDFTRRAALDESRDSGTLHFTPPGILARETPEQHGVLVFCPVYEGRPSTVEERRKNLRGFISAVYRIGDIVENATRVFQPGGDVALRLVDESAPEGFGTLYERGAADGSTLLPAMTYRQTLDVVSGRSWSVHATPTTAYVSARRTRLPVAAFLAGLLFTALLIGWLRIVASRARAVESVVARTRDLTDATERLERQKDILQSILDNLGDGVAVADEHGSLTMFNPAAEGIVGRGPVDTGPETWSDEYNLFLPDACTPFPPDELPLAHAVAGRESRDVELFVGNPKRRGGVFIRVTATPLKDKKGSPRGGVAVFRDITERKWTEAVLRDSEARFRAIVEATASALIILASDYRIKEFNPRAEQIFGVARADALGQDFFELCLPEEYRDAVALDIKRALAGEPTPGFEIPAQTRSGAERTLLWSFSRLTESKDRPMVIIATGHDITERRQAEEARRDRELAVHLEAARENERARLAREIHDELGQELTGLKFEISALKRRSAAGDAEVHRRLDDVGQMIDGTIASVQRLAAALRPQILDELGLLEAVRWQAKEFEQRTGVSCRVELPEEEFRWGQDRATAMFRVLQESLTNVARHAEAQHVTVRVQRRADQVILEVSDDGIGITKDQISDYRSFGLLGMRERARMFGGVLSISGEKGRGTTVTARMPY